MSKVQEIFLKLKEESDKCIPGASSAITRMPPGKVQKFSNEKLNMYFFRSGFTSSDKYVYYVIVEHAEEGPLQPLLYTADEIKEKTGIQIDDY